MVSRHMEIQIPSPSVFLRRSPVPSSVPTPGKKSKPRGTQSKQAVKSSNATKANNENGAVTKPKQSKSRNGCMTCKKKRLKCDETKPTCFQCERRHVECEGYKKDYKWRTFEETNKQSRAGKTKKVDSSRFETTLSIRMTGEPHKSIPLQQENQQPWSPELQHAFSSTNNAITHSSNIPDTASLSSPLRRFSPSRFEPLPILHPGFSPSDIDLPLPFPYHPPARIRDDRSSHSSFSTVSPNLVDLLLPGTDLRQPPHSSELRPSMSPRPYQPGLVEAVEHVTYPAPEEDEFDEEVIRQPIPAPLSNEHWDCKPSSPAPSDTSSTSSISTNMSILRPPALDLASPELLMLRFDTETCGILSIKDGPSENPWRTLIWPLAKDSHALYHAISSMTALHGATRNPQLRIAGMAHMTKSISKLSSELGQMGLEQALATTLALALGEGWDEKISTGIQHLRGAKILLNKALALRHQQIQVGQSNDEDSKRLKFLCNTYVYLDVIARLTSAEEHEPIDLDKVLEMVNEPFGSVTIEVDPLMGCATTLFPLIGKVASLIQQVRRTKSNSLNIVSEANELREQLLHWHPPDVDLIEQPEDRSSDIRHAIHTAEAYRWATILHLHQAVPELALESSHAQARNILTILAGTPLSSRTLIVQIFPLMVGSCEMVAIEDRQWVCQRWEAMMQRLSIVNVASCWETVREVWRRRDAYVQEQRQKLSFRTTGRNVSPGSFIPPNLKRKMQSSDAVTEEIFMDVCGVDPVFSREHNERPLKRRLTFDAQSAASGGVMALVHRRRTNVTMSGVYPEHTVRGNLHWLGVMADWNWEVFLG